MNDFWTAFSALVAALAIIGGAYAFGRTSGYRQAKADLNNERQAKRFTEIYAPLVGLFTTCHITTTSALGAPHLNHRIYNAWRCLLSGNLLSAMRAVFDIKDFGSTAEVEFGDPFPRAMITEHLKGREQFSDDKLIVLLARANRAQYEEHPYSADLTAADLALFRHVCRQHEILSARFVGS